MDLNIHLNDVTLMLSNRLNHTNGKIQIGVKYAIYFNNLLTFLIAGSFVASGKLTLEDAIGIALHKNFNFLKDTSQLEGFESNVQAAYGNFLPTWCQCKLAME
jgi:hypothetical protein